MAVPGPVTVAEAENTCLTLTEKSAVLGGKI